MTQIMLPLATHTMFVCLCILGEAAVLPCSAEQATWPAIFFLTCVSSHSLAAFAHTQCYFSGRSNLATKSVNWNCNYICANLSFSAIKWL